MVIILKLIKVSFRQQKIKFFFFFFTILSLKQQLIIAQSVFEVAPRERSQIQNKLSSCEKIEQTYFPTLLT